jgi:hypothetical protein
MTEYKDFAIFGDGTYGMHYVKRIGKGALPNELQGSFTHPLFAQRAIDTYLTKKEPSRAEADITD